MEIACEKNHFDLNWAPMYMEKTESSSFLDLPHHQVLARLGEKMEVVEVDFSRMMHLVEECGKEGAREGAGEGARERKVGQAPKSRQDGGARQQSSLKRENYEKWKQT